VYGSDRERFYANRVALDYLGMSLDEWRQRSFALKFILMIGAGQVVWERAASNGSAHESDLRFHKM